ncbi:G5 domain-containing protein [Georgenia yuyongxinii]
MSANHRTQISTVSAEGVETSVRAKRRLLPWLALGIVPVLVAGGAVTAQAHKSVDLEINGQRHTLSTFAGSVEGLLTENGIALGERDLLAPAPDTALTDGADVVVRTAREVTVQVDGEEQQVWTTALTSGEVVASLFESGREVSVAASRSLAGGRQALDMPLVVDGEADVVADGATTRVELAGTAFVPDALEAAGVEVDRTDRVEVRTGENAIPEVVVTRMDRGERTETEPVPFETVERADPTMLEGETEVVQEGVPGELTRTFVTVTVDGKEASSEQTREEVTTEPVDKIVAVGTKARPAPAPAPAAEAPAAASGGTAAAAPAPAPAPAPATGDVWARLAQCESGGNPTIVSANGLYHGLYQFSVGTWQSVGGTGLPSQASPAEQTQRAQALQARSGWGQWPACASKLGLL